jgi:methionyl-tRNA formyltransferase
MQIVYLAQSCATATPPLRGLLAAGQEVRAVVLAGGAGARPGEPERIAAEAGVLIVRAASAAEATAVLQAIAPAAAVAACFPWRLGRLARQVPPLGILNVHPSLLPAGRGSEPVFWTLRRGEPVTGVTVHRMDAGFDTGPIVAQRALAVDAGVRAPDLEAELMTLGGQLLVAALPALAAGTLRPRPQPETGASQAPPPSAADWTMATSLPAAWAWRFARGVSPLRGPLAVIAGGAAIPVADALDWAPDERLPHRVMDEGDGTMRIRFAPGWVRFRRAGESRTGE